MKVLLIIVAICVPIMLFQWMYMRLTNQIKTPKHHKNDDYIDNSFKFNFNEERLKAISGEGNNDNYREN